MAEESEPKEKPIIDVEAQAVESEEPPQESADERREPPPDEAPSEQTAEEPDDEQEALYCTQCGSKMRPGERFCGRCGWDTENPEKTPPGADPLSPRELGPLSGHNRLTVLLLCVFVGWLGVHRFYVGRVPSGILWLLTMGFLGIGVLYDLVLIATGEFRDEKERRVWHWN